MASRAFFVVAMIIAVAIAPTMATDYMVGDDKGWKLGVNYADWAAGKTFYVGDTITFMYKQGSHNVYKVTGPDFQQCNTSNSLGGALTGGNDVVTLAKPGKKWYICGVADHCSKGMKLVIMVSDPLSPGPTPSPVTGAPGSPSPSAATQIMQSSLWMLAVAVAYRMLVA